jgi:hypothetical protein
MQVDKNKQTKWRVVIETGGIAVEEVIKPIEKISNPEVKEYLVEAEEVATKVPTYLYDRSGKIYKIERCKSSISQHA